MFELTTGYWITVWIAMGIAVLVIWFAIVLGSSLLDRSESDSN